MDSIPLKFRDTGLPDFLRARPDDSIRCKACGMTIAEHSNAPVGRIGNEKANDDAKKPEILLLDVSASDWKATEDLCIASEVERFAEDNGVALFRSKTGKQRQRSALSNDCRNS